MLNAFDKNDALVCLNRNGFYLQICTNRNHFDLYVKHFFASLEKIIKWNSLHVFKPGKIGGTLSLIKHQWGYTGGKFGWKFGDTILGEFGATGNSWDIILNQTQIMTLCCTMQVRTPLKDISIHADRRNVIHPLLSKVALFRLRYTVAGLNLLFGFPGGWSGFHCRCRLDGRRIGSCIGHLQGAVMCGGNFAALAVAETDCHHGFWNFQHLTGAPLHGACVAYKATDFDYHWHLPLCLKNNICGDKKITTISEG